MYQYLKLTDLYTLFEITNILSRFEKKKKKKNNNNNNNNKKNEHTI